MSAAEQAARAKVSDEHQRTFDLLVAMIREITAAHGAYEESLKWGFLCFHQGKDNYMSLMPQTQRINFQIFNGAHLPDPKGLIEGTGKDMRHIKVSGPEFIAENRAALAQLIVESLARPDQLAR